MITTVLSVIESPALYYAYWCASIVLYGIKIVWPPLDNLTRYGKLLEGKDQERYSSSLPWWHPFSSRLIPHGIGFTSFYAVGFLFVVARAVSVYSMNGEVSATLAAFMVIFAFQLLRRFFECCFVHKWHPSRRMVTINCIYGCSFYFFVVFSPLSSHQHLDLFSLRMAILGVCFLAASLMQFHSHIVLARTVKYNIPNGFLYKFVVCPHYVAEILLYGILALGFGSQMPTLYLVFIFVVLNLSDNARATLKWYQSRGVQLGSVKAVIPFVF